jgi:hypothetical protein
VIDHQQVGLAALGATIIDQTEPKVVRRAVDRGAFGKKVGYVNPHSVTDLRDAASTNLTRELVKPHL